MKENKQDYRIYYVLINLIESINREQDESKKFEQECFKQSLEYILGSEKTKNFYNRPKTYLFEKEGKNEN